MNCTNSSYSYDDGNAPAKIRPYLPLKNLSGVPISSDREWTIAYCNLPYIGWKQNVFVQHTRKEEAVKRVKKFSESPPTLDPPPSLDVNVLVILMDDISRRQFERSFLQTYDFLSDELSKKSSPVNIYHFDRYNILGPNSLPNQYPLFVGKNIPNGMSDQSQYNMIFSSTSNDDWIWNYYASRGYVTMYGIETAKGPFVKVFIIISIFLYDHIVIFQSGAYRSSIFEDFLRGNKVWWNRCEFSASIQARNEGLRRRSSCARIHVRLRIAAFGTLWRCEDIFGGKLDDGTRKEFDAGKARGSLSERLLSLPPNWIYE